MSLVTRVAATLLVLLLSGVVVACDLIDPPGEVVTAKLIVDPGPNPSIQDLAAAQAAAVRYADQAGTRSVAQAVVDELGLVRSATDLQDAIQTDVDEATFELTIEVRDEDPEVARDIALALGNEMIERVEAGLVGESVGQDNRSLMQGQIDELFEAIVEPRPEPTMVRNRLLWSDKPER